MKSKKMILCITAVTAGSFIAGGITGALILKHFYCRRNGCLPPCDPEKENQENDETVSQENSCEEVTGHEK